MIKSIKHTFYASLIILLTAFFFYSCKNEEPKPEQIPENDTELITTMQLNFTDSADLNKLTFEFNDPDGEGGNAPDRFDTIVLKPNRSYYLNITLLDRSKSDVDTISNEVLSESNDHLIVFKVITANASIQIQDKDDSGLPLGLLSKWITGNKSTGTVTITLKHQPGIKDGSPDKGETDAEVMFPLRIE